MSRASAAAAGERRASTLIWGGMLLGGVVAALWLSSRPSDEVVEPVHLEVAQSKPVIERFRIDVVRRIPHATDAFTQGLLWHRGLLYESVGQYGASALRKLDPANGDVLKETDLDNALFGEGLARVDERLIQLTWRSGKALTWSLDAFAPGPSFSYAGEGWGLCFDGAQLVMSDGSATLTFRNPQTFAVERSQRVTRRGLPVPRLNELECVGSHVYANIWGKDEIVRIVGRSGEVDGEIDASGLLTDAEARRADVLNGIAHDAYTDLFYITGKNWPHIFEARLVPR